MTPSAVWLLLAASSGALPLPPPWPLPLPPPEPAPLPAPGIADALRLPEEGGKWTLAPGLHLAPGAPEEPRRPGATDGPATRDPNRSWRDLLLDATPGLTLQVEF
ncbi:MAG: hypothetical protein NZ523_11025 [Elioraea sp.]|nr:hypothetical protein [Elioraea sp.]